MVEEIEFKKKMEKGEVEEIKEERKEKKPRISDKDEHERLLKPKLDDYISFLEKLRVVKKEVSSAPTATPKSFIEQFSLYESSGTYRLYTYIKDAWKKIYDSSGPVAHKTTHEDGGSDEISVAGLSGLLGDAQTPLSHALDSHSVPVGNIAMNSKKFTGLVDPTANQDSATKKYVDDNAGASDYAAGDNLLVGNGPEGSSTAGAYEKIMEVRIDRGGTLRIKFDLHAEGGSPNEVNGRIYRNGVAVGTERETQSLTYVNYSEDISGWSAGDLVQLYVYKRTDTKAWGQNLEVHVDSYEKPENITGWQTLSIDSIYQAKTNGMVVVLVTVTGTSGRIDGYTDSSNPPTTLRCYDYFQVDYHPNGGFTMPVKKDDYFEVNDDSDNVSGSVTIYWLPITF